MAAAPWRSRLELMRPGNGAMVVVAVWLGAAHTVSNDTAWWFEAGAALNEGHHLATWLAAPLAAFLVTSFGNVLNDVLDRRIDAQAHPLRPLPAGRITARQAAAWSATLLAAGLAMAWLAGPLLLLFAAANAVLLAGYEWRLKRLPATGNATVAVLVASAFAFGSLAAGGDVRQWDALWWIMAMVALTTFARELLKDIEDQGADIGRRTLPMALGAGAAGWIASGAVGAAVGIDAMLVWTQDAWRLAGRAVLAAAGVGFLAASGAGCWRAGLGQRALKVAMVVALVGLALAP